MFCHMLYERYCELRTNVERMQNLLNTEYLSNIASEVKVNPKRFWSFAKSKRKVPLFRNR